nr:hypothetical protein [Nitrosomonas nitrosa]
MSFVNERKEDGTWQTIDRERNIVLRYLGGGRPQEPIEFNLCIEGKDFLFYAFQKTNRLKSGKLHVDWRVVKIFHLPPTESDKAKLRCVIEEALESFGFASSRENVETLSVTFAHNL